MAIIAKIKKLIKPLRRSNHIFLRYVFFFLLSLKNFFNFFISTSYRSQSISKIRYKKHFHQISHYTEANRYPDLFEICRDYLREEMAPKILSYGCSTGEEVFSLSKYLPDALIVGTDISKWCIKEANKKNIEKKFLFLHSESKQFSLLDKFDAIFCLAVFQHTNNRDEYVTEATKYIFSQFEQQLIVLDKKLKTGGLLFIDNSDFDFLESKIVYKYFPLQMDNNKVLRERPLFNKSNNHISNTMEIYRVFKKLKS